MFKEHLALAGKHQKIAEESEFDLFDSIDSIHQYHQPSIAQSSSYIDATRLTRVECTSRGHFQNRQRFTLLIAVTTSFPFPGVSTSNSFRR